MTDTALRVAVTRDEGPDGPLSEALRRHGLEPVPCATVRHTPSPEPGRLARAARELESYDWLVVASVRAVEALMAARDGAPIPAKVRTAAVGARTAAALVAHGAQEPLQAARAGAAPLADALHDADAWRGRRVLLPRAARGETRLPDVLELWGAEVHAIAAYETVANPPEVVRAAWTAAAPEVVVVASPSAVRSLVHAVGLEALRQLEPVFAIGPTTADALAAFGISAAVPPRTDFESMAAFVRGAARVPAAAATAEVRPRTGRTPYEDLP